MKKVLLSVFFVFTLVSPIAFADTIKVMLEPMPPFINPNFKTASDPGLSVNLLKAIEKELGDTFEFKEAPYVRLKKDLETGRVDLVGHMPYQLEVKEFYEYGLDVDWKIDVISDIYVMKKADLNRIKELKIGTPRGNKEFAAEMTGIPIDHFYDSGSIESLLRMLYSGRLDAFWFPRATTMPMIRESGEKVYYKQFPEFKVPACFSVQNNAAGKALKQKLEAAIEKIDTQNMFKVIHEFNSLPNQGEIN